jgi:hypothetical protein
VALFRATAVHRILAFRGFPTQPAVSPLSETILSCRYVWLVKAETNMPQNVSRQVNKGVSSKLSTSLSNCLSIRKRSCKPSNHGGSKGRAFFTGVTFIASVVLILLAPIPLKAKSKLFFSKGSQRS